MAKYWVSKNHVPELWVQCDRRGVVTYLADGKKIDMVEWLRIWEKFYG